MGERGRYTLVQRLARGGMGEVHLAVAHGIGGVRKLVVIKQVLEGLADDAELAEMFLNEARLAASLDHPHIVAVHDVCEIDGRPSLVMEYVHGESLGRLLQLAAATQTPLALADALTVVDAVAGALAYAHEARSLDGEPLHIVHRDVAPNNILVGYAGDVKLIDFGLARALAATRITRGNAVKGKAAYMAPEQFTGGEIDGRTDVFALGIVLYEASTMHRAFRADNEAATLNRIAGGDLVRPRDVLADYPAALEQVVMTALATRPDDRFASAAAFRAALGDVARELGIAYSLAHVGETARTLGGERPRPRIESLPLPAEERRWLPHAKPAFAFAAGVLATAAAGLVLFVERADGHAGTTSTSAANERAATTVCGNATREAGEDCDDGNARDGDGCNRDCHVSGAPLWERTFQGDDPGNTRDDRAYRVAIDGKDDIVVVGEAAVPDAGQNIFVRKYDRDGNERWTKQPGKAGDDEAWAVHVAADDGVVVGGYVASATTGRDFWLAAFDGDGRERWQYELDAAALGGGTGERSDDEIRGLYFTPPNRIVVVGKSLVRGAEDRVAAHGTVDAAGISLVSWGLAAQEQPGGWDAVADVVRTGDGWVLTGDRTRFEPWGTKSMWVGWFDDRGTLVHETAIDPPDRPTPAGGVGRQLARTGDTILLAGSLGGWGREADAWYGALDARGTVAWSRTHDGPSSKRDFAQSITVDREGNIVVVGEVGGDPGRNADGREESAHVWIVKLSPDLDELWSELYNGPENERDVAFDVATDSTNAIVVVGYQSVAGNGYDLWVRKYRP